MVVYEVNKMIVLHLKCGSKKSGVRCALLDRSSELQWRPETKNRMFYYVHKMHHIIIPVGTHTFPRSRIQVYVYTHTNFISAPLLDIWISLASHTHTRADVYRAIEICFILLFGIRLHYIENALHYFVRAHAHSISHILTNTHSAYTRYLHVNSKRMDLNIIKT